VYSLNGALDEMDGRKDVAVIMCTTRDWQPTKESGEKKERRIIGIIRLQKNKNKVIFNLF
jgi:hypothetical protein